MAKTKHKFLSSKRAVNAVISNIILLGAVIVVGFAVLAWSQSQTIQYQNTQQGIIQQNANQLKERITFEYASFNSTTKILKVFIMNVGTIGNLNISSVKIGDYSPMNSINLYKFDNSPINGLSTGQEGYFTVNTTTFNPQLSQGTAYSITVITGRGSSFASTFAL